MKTKARRIMELLNNDPTLTDKQVARKISCVPSYVHTVRKKMVHVYDEAAEITGGMDKPKQEEVAKVREPYVPDLYIDLASTLEEAYNQAAYGKGAERHANNDPWIEQPIFKIASQAGDGFNVGQVIKKVQEAQQMAARGETDRARHEVLGAIVYAASLYVIWGKAK